MKFIYLTAKTYPASTADHIYIRELAKGFNVVLRNSFLLIVANNFGNDLHDLPVLNLRLSLSRFRTFFYLFWLPYFILRGRHTKNDTIFFSNDPNLLAVLIFWKKVLHFRYKVCSDWHMFFGDWRDRFIMRGSDSMVTTSAKLKNAIVAISGVKEEKILVAYGGVDLTKYPLITMDEARTRTEIPKDKKIITYAGFFKTMGMEKGIRMMIEALPMLPEEIMMLFVGGTDEEILEYTIYAGAVGVASRCIFIARKSQEELAIYEAASDVLTIPYPDQPHFRDFGFPMKVYEYMAIGRPIIYSRLELTEEAIAPYSHDFAPDNAADFSHAVLDVLENYPFWKDKATQAMEVVKKYSWENKARAALDFIQI